MRRVYSRLGRTEESRNIRRAVVFSFLTLAALTALLFFGIPTVAKFASFLADLRKTSSPVEINDTTPPAPPRINPLPEATNKEVLDLSGTTENGATVILVVDGAKQEILADKDGVFTFKVNLKKGENTILAFAKDRAGNESQKSLLQTVIFDNEKPSLDISSPKDGQEFFGTRERQISIQGTTKAGSSLTINDRLVKVEDNGAFTFVTSLNEGGNSFNLKTTDKAGNTAEKTISVRFSP